MLHRVLLTAGWMFPLLVVVLFVVKGQFYDPSVFMPPASEAAALPIPVALGNWVLENGTALPADRMFEKINGKADYYLQYGATELSCGEWVANGQRWDMYLYRFGQDQGARGAYNGEKPSDGKPIEGMEGYAVPGQAAMTIGTYYLQLNAQAAGADAGPAVELAGSLAPFLGGTPDGAERDKQVDLAALAGGDMIGDAEGFIPESAFGFSAFNDVRTVQVSLDGVETIWFTTPGRADLVAAYLEELELYGGENLFAEAGASGGAMFGSWSMAGILEEAVWGVQNATSKDALMQHWNTLKKRLETATEGP